MRPTVPEKQPQEDRFRQELVNLIDLRHPLCRLAAQIPWTECEETFGAWYAENGRPGIAIRLMVGLHYLKHTYALSDEEVVLRWVENPYWQYFCGEVVFQHRLPIDPSQMTRFRKRIGEGGCETLFRLTIEAGKKTQTIKARSLKRRWWIRPCSPKRWRFLRMRACISRV